MTKRTTARELIARLSELPGDAPIFVHGYEGGYHDAGELQPTKMKLDVQESGLFGPHDETWYEHDPDEYDVEGFVIERKDDEDD